MTDVVSTDAASESDTEAGSCHASCGTPAGTVQPFMAVADEYQALIGRWYVCGDGLATFFEAPSDAIGVEYGPASEVLLPSGDTAGGDMYYLVQGPTGPTRGQGFDYQLTYDVGNAGYSPQGAPILQLNMHPSPTSGFGGSVRYSPCPTELSVQGDGVAGAVLVPVY